MNRRELTPEVERLLEALTRDDRTAALRLVHALWSAGVAPRTLIEKLLVPVERRIGSLWQDGVVEFGVANRSSAIIAESLERMVAMTHPDRTQHERAGPIVVMCPPGEWHGLPGRFVAAVLLLEGWPCEFAGASTPVAAIEACVAQRPLAALLSCTMARNLLAAADMVDALQSGSVPVIVGGAAFGLDDRRAKSIGAQGWASTAGDAARLLAHWQRERPVARVGSDARRDGALAFLNPVSTASIADSALRSIDRMFARPEHEIWRWISAQDLVRTLEVVGASIRTGDEGILTAELTWWRRYLAARGVESGVVSGVLDALAGASPPGPVRALLLRHAPGDPGDGASEPEVVGARRRAS